MEKKNYVGSGKKMNDTWLTVSLNMDKVAQFIEEYKGHKFVRLNINIKEEVDQFGKDVSISINDYKPDGPLGRVEKKKAIQEEPNDLPF